MSATFGIAVDLLVAILLVATIVTSIGLSRRVARMKADEAAMRNTIGDLVIATDSAERAVATLRATLGDCDRTLGERLRIAEQYSADLADRVQAGETVMSRINQIVESSRRAAVHVPREAANAPEAEGRQEAKKEVLRAAALAAQAVADRATRRLEADAA
jgi:ABC-type transporter Mla subunit MlaD